MKLFSAGLDAHLQQRVTTLCTCIKITRQDGTIIGVTSHDVQLPVDGVIYQVARMANATELAQKADASVDNQEMDWIVDAAVISERDLESGLYDYATIEVLLVNYLDTTQFAIMKRGHLGEVSLADQVAKTEFRSLAQALQQTIGRAYGPDCDAVLGDSRCKVGLASITSTGYVTAVLDSHRIQISLGAAADDYFNYGLLTFTDGANAGIGYEVKDWDQASQTITLMLPARYTVAAGDQFSVYAGCDKAFATCRDKFNNVVNFRGFPDVPGTDGMLETPDV